VEICRKLIAKEVCNSFDNIIAVKLKEFHEKLGRNEPISLKQAISVSNWVNSSM
jgi:hypothetical protein